MVIRKLNVLVADDNDDVRLTISLTIQDLRDCTVTEARDGKEALGLLAQMQYDALFLDMEMPRIDGWGVLDRLAKGKGLRPHYIAIISASANEKERQAALIEFGADVCIPKPFREEQILDALNAAYGRAVSARVTSLPPAMQA